MKEVTCNSNGGGSGNRGGGSRSFYRCSPLSRSFPQCPSAVEEPPTAAAATSKPSLGSGPGPESGLLHDSCPADPDRPRALLEQERPRPPTPGWERKEKRGNRLPQNAWGENFSFCPAGFGEGRVPSATAKDQVGAAGSSVALVRSPANSKRRSAEVAALKGLIKPSPYPGAPEARKMDLN